ncbi:MAG TPA: type II secretion system protein GspJ [Candidatus Binatia bacterium]|jgi:type II secretion system protein J|nr:type II secretion system protein GspJ [Candidatus Binatia bacterium]
MKLVSSQLSVSSQWPSPQKREHPLPTTDCTLLTAHTSRNQSDFGFRPSFGLRVSAFGFRTPHPCSAFTLVEILVALGIFSLVLASIYSTWTAILRASKVGRDAAAAVQRARIAGRTIEESLVSAQSFAITQQSHPEYYSFSFENGSEAYLEFTSRLATSFPRSGKFGGFDVRRVMFSIEPSPDHGRQLVLRQRPLLMDLDKDEREHPIVLAKNVKGFKIECWDSRNNNKLDPWVDEWTRTNELPEMVKITLQLADNTHTSVVREEVTRIVSIPGMTIQPGWQPYGQRGGMPVPPPPPPPK